MLPAADFEALLVRPSRNVFDAAVAAFVEVVFLGALRCDKALPEDVFVVLPVLLLRSVFDADEPAFFPVTFLPMIVLLVVYGLVYSLEKQADKPQALNSINGSHLVNIAVTVKISHTGHGPHGQELESLLFATIVGRFHGIQRDLRVLLIESFRHKVATEGLVVVQSILNAFLKSFQCLANSLVEVAVTKHLDDIVLLKCTPFVPPRFASGA